MFKQNFLYFSLCKLTHALLSTRVQLCVSHQVFTCWISFLNLLFSKLKSLSSFRLSLSIRGPNLLMMLMGLCWTHSSMFMSLLYWRAQTWTHHPRSVTPVLSRQEGSPLLPCCKLFPLRRLLAIFSTMAHTAGA